MSRGYKTQTMLSVGFGAGNTTYTGAMSGDIYVWSDYQVPALIRVISHGPNNIASSSVSLALLPAVTTDLYLPCTPTLHSAMRPPSYRLPRPVMHQRELFAYSLLQDGFLKVWTADMTKNDAYHLPQDSSPRSISCAPDGKVRQPPLTGLSIFNVYQIIIGTKSNDILELTAEHKWRVVNMGHGEGQLWGLALHPSKVRISRPQRLLKRSHIVLLTAPFCHGQRR